MGNRQHARRRVSGHNSEPHGPYTDRWQGLRTSYRRFNQRADEYLRRYNRLPKSDAPPQKHGCDRHVQRQPFRLRRSRRQCGRLDTGRGHGRDQRSQFAKRGTGAYGSDPGPRPVRARHRCPPKTESFVQDRSEDRGGRRRSHDPAGDRNPPDLRAESGGSSGQIRIRHHRPRSCRRRERARYHRGYGVIDRRQHCNDSQRYSAVCGHSGRLRMAAGFQRVQQRRDPYRRKGNSGCRDA